ncbi:MAG: FoF1 ATP synthase subunit a [Dehalococcoidales bacterium]|nr:FoF1 ATP synthase subunit a [Dehalococcoidales bacterium]
MAEQKPVADKKTGKKIGCLGCSFSLGIFIFIIAVLVLFIVSLALGPIGQGFLGIKPPEWLSVPTPHVLLPAEVIIPMGEFAGQEYGITNSIITTWLTMVILVIISLVVIKRSKLIPSRFQSLIESVFEWLYNFCKEAAGEKNGRRFFPIITTIILFVLFNGWLSLLPGFGSIMVHTAEGHELPLLRGANTDINTPLALALISFVFIETVGIASGGLHYLKKFMNVGRFFKGWGKIFRGQVKSGFGDLFFGVIDGVVSLIEFISEFFRVISLTFRLFGNMLGGEILVLMFLFLFFVTPIIIPHGLELIFGLIQALIFGFLTLVFASIAATPHEGEGH